MKKSLKIAVAASVLASPALAVEVVGVPAQSYSNMENPLFAPTAGQFYSKTGLGIMYKEADHSTAMEMKGRGGATEWPIYRINESLGFGITDRLVVRGSFGYTQDDDINRKGLNEGRLGLAYRVFDGSATDGWVWDLYADAHLGGVSKMTGSYTPNGFNYDNYTNGRWGYYVGTQFGKTWGKFTGALFGEFLQTFGNDNNEIDVTAMKAEGAAGAAQAGAAIAAMGGAAAVQSACVGGITAACELLQSYGMATGLAGMTDNISVNLKGTFEYNFGIKGIYEFNDAWSMTGAFTYKHHADNGIESVATKQNNELAQGVADGLAASMSDMKDGWDDYIIGLSVANKLTENIQVALYGEYTMDDSHPMSQNGTDMKLEGGVRVNVLF